MAAKRNLLVGLFVAGGVLLFAVGLFWIGDRRMLFSRSIPLTAEFANLSGLKVGAKVQVQGMDAGEVVATNVPVRPGAKFRVHFRVLDKFQPILRTDSVASIQMEGLVGSKVLQIEAGTEAGTPVEAGTVLQGREPVEIGQIIDLTVETIRKVNDAVDEVEERVVKAVDTVTEVADTSHKVVAEVGRDVDDLFTVTNRSVGHVSAMLEGVREGRGTVGKLLTDDGVYERVRDTVANLEATTDNVRQTSENVNAIVADLRSRNIGEHAEQTVANLRETTARAKEVVGGLVPSEGSEGPMEELRAAITHTREATADLADNMEALKRNWLFRGFFRRRGFYDLNAVSVEDYVAGKVAPNRPRERSWVHRQELFTTDAEGDEVLSAAGRTTLQKLVTPYLRYAPNTPMMVEGYASEGPEAARFLRSRDRAQVVRRYIIDRFGLNARYVGVVPMGGVASESGELWDGVALVYFPERETVSKK